MARWRMKRRIPRVRLEPVDSIGKKQVEGRLTPEQTPTGAGADLGDRVVGVAEPKGQEKSCLLWLSAPSLTRTFD